MNAADAPLPSDRLRVFPPLPLLAIACHGAHCCGCWDLIVAGKSDARGIVAQSAAWECNECGERREAQPPGETL
jgi:hypothetical protein